MLLVAPAVDVEVNAAGAAAAVVIAVAFHLQVALPAACCLPPSACCYWLCPPVMQERIERRIHQAQLTDSLALLCSVLEFALGFFDLLRALAFAFSCAMR